MSDKTIVDIDGKIQGYSYHVDRLLDMGWSIGDAEKEALEFAKKPIKQLVVETLNSIEVPEKDGSTDEELLYSSFDVGHRNGFNKAIDLFQQAIDKKVKEVSGE